MNEVPLPPMPEPEFVSKAMELAQRWCDHFRGPDKDDAEAEFRAHLVSRGSQAKKELGMNRENFEAWVEQKFGPEQSGVSPLAYEWMLDAWDASAERCAKLCDVYAVVYGKGNPAEMARICAAAIRSNSQSKQEEA